MIVCCRIVDAEYRRSVVGFGRRFKELSIRALRNVARNPALMFTQVCVVCSAVGRLATHLHPLLVALLRAL
jgi:hypothetical protein